MRKQGKEIRNEEGLLCCAERIRTQFPSSRFAGKEVHQTGHMHLKANVGTCPQNLQAITRGASAIREFYQAAMNIHLCGTGETRE